MARPTSISLGAVSSIRLKTGSPVTDDSATLTDANFSPTTDPSTGGAIDCVGLGTIWVGVEFVAAGAVTLVLDMLVRDAEAADGSRWKRLLLGAPPGITPIAAPVIYAPVLDGTGFKEIRVDGRRCYPRIHTITGAPTSVRLIAFTGSTIQGVRRFQ